MLTYRALRLHLLGENETAREVSRESLQIAEDVGDRAAQAYALTTLGHALAELGDNGATDAYRKALEIRRELDQPNLATEPQAGLASLAVATADPEQAKSHIDTILDYLETGDLDGTLEPLRVYVTCVQVLLALKDDRAAEVVERANLVLHRQAYRIHEQALESLFFTSVYATLIQELQNATKKDRSL